MAGKQCDCARCLPRILCITEIVDPVTGTGSGTGTDHNTACEYKWSQRYDCGTKEWSGSGGTLSFLYVSLVKSGIQLPCEYNISAVLEWDEGTDNPDLDLYVRDATDSEVCWFGNTTAGALSLNHDACDGCATTPSPPEIIVGAFTSSKTFNVWYNQYSDCAAEAAPTSSTFTVNNTGESDLLVTVSGLGSFKVLAGTSEIVLRRFPSAGYNVGASPDFMFGAEVTVECIPSTMCSTKVNCEYLPEPLYFDGVIKNIKFDVVDDAGNGLQITIDTADTVENPLYYDKCSPCATNACLPKFLCVNIGGCQTSGDFQLGIPNGILTWDCGSRSWTGPTIYCGTNSYDVTVSLAGLGLHFCGVNLAISGTNLLNGEQTSSSTSYGFVTEYDAFFSIETTLGDGSAVTITHMECGYCPLKCCCYCDGNIKLPSELYVTIVATPGTFEGGGPCPSPPLTFVIPITCIPGTGIWAGGITVGPDCANCGSDYPAGVITSMSAVLETCYTVGTSGDFNLFVSGSCVSHDFASGYRVQFSTSISGRPTIVDCHGPIFEWLNSADTQIGQACFTVFECGAGTVTATVTG